MKKLINIKMVFVHNYAIQRKLLLIFIYKYIYITHILLNY
jgi:hypothetical protein